MADWTDVCALEEIEEEDVIRFDHGGRPSPSTATWRMACGAPTGFVRMSRCTWPTAS
jgi:nitrite reductase/ring-hydroxylating ferredoxin subunit